MNELTCVIGVRVSGGASAVLWLRCPVSGVRDSSPFTSDPALCTRLHPLNSDSAPAPRADAPAGVSGCSFFCSTNLYATQNM